MVEFKGENYVLFKALEIGIGPQKKTAMSYERLEKQQKRFLENQMGLSCNPRRVGGVQKTIKEKKTQFKTRQKDKDEDICFRIQFGKESSK